MIEVQRCHDKEQWDEYVLENGGHPLQLWGWGQVKAAHGWTAERFCIYDEDRQVAAVQVLIRKLPSPLVGMRMQMVTSTNLHQNDKNLHYKRFCFGRYSSRNGTVHGHVAPTK